MRTKEEVLQAASRARNKWKDSGDPIWACAEGVLAWVLEEPVMDYIEEVLEPLCFEETEDDLHPYPEVTYGICTLCQIPYDNPDHLDPTTRKILHQHNPDN